MVVTNAFPNSGAAWSIIAVVIAVWFNQHFPKKEMFDKKNSIVVMDDDLKHLHEGYRVSRRRVCVRVCLCLCVRS